MYIPMYMSIIRTFLIIRIIRTEPKINKSSNNPALCTTGLLEQMYRLSNSNVWFYPILLTPCAIKRLLSNIYNRHGIQKLFYSKKYYVRFLIILVYIIMSISDKFYDEFATHREKERRQTIPTKKNIWWNATISGIRWSNVGVGIFAGEGFGWDWDVN